MTPDPRDRLIVALDMAEVDAARQMVDRIGDAATFYKVGYRLAFAGGLPFVQELAARGLKLFLDLKLHDIGNTVEEGVASLARLGATFATVHAYPQTMAAAVRGRAGSQLRILAVTVLTSWDDADVAEAGYRGDVTSLVRLKARQANDAGIDGIVCSAAEAALVRDILGPDRLIVTPGVRPDGADAGDQKRVVTPFAAAALGVDHIVVGRPIVEASDPQAMAARIIDSFEAGRRTLSP